MKTMRRIISLLLTVLLLGNLFPSAFAAEEADVYIRGYAPQSYVTVAGNAGLDYINYDASVMMLKAAADLENLEEDDIAYIGQSTIDHNGNYRFEFKFTGFTDDDNDNIIDNYKIVLNVAGKDITDTVEIAENLTNFVQFELDMSQFGNAVATLTNAYDLSDLKYTMFISFYNEKGKLLKVEKSDKFTGDASNISYTYRDIPSGTSYAKAFVWETLDRIVPLAGVESFDVLNYTTNRSVQCLTVAPGIDETERNFAWYDIPGIDGARIEYAVKNSENDLNVFPEESAVTVEGICGDVDVSEYIGMPLRAERPDEALFEYPGAYAWAKATIKDLEPGKEYVYRLGDQLGWCKGIYEFKTEADPSQGFNMLLFTDEHAASKPLRATSSKAFELCPDANMVYSMGDLVDIPWKESEYKSYFDREYMPSIPLAVVPGTTHDMFWNPREASIHGYHFNMPNLGTADNEDSRVTENVGANYWFVYGDVLFIALLHNGTTSTDISLNKSYINRAVEEAEEKYPNIKWKVLCAHFPFWGNEGSEKNHFHNSDSDFLADAGIDIVFNGHMHQSYRTHQMYGNKVVMDTTGLTEVTDPEGVVHVVLNTTGYLAENRAVDESYMAFNDKENCLYYWGNESIDAGRYTTHFSTLEIITTEEECSLKLTTYKNDCERTSGEILETKVIDTYKIIKTK